MTNKELIEAARSMLSYGEQYLDDLESDPNCPIDHLHDAVRRNIIIRTYLREHMEDDDDLIDDDWLIPLGHIDGLVLCIGQLRRVMDEPNWSIEDENGFGEAYINPPKDKGEFRRLCRSLNIPLKEKNE